MESFKIINVVERPLLPGAKNRLEETILSDPLTPDTSPTPMRFRTAINFLVASNITNDIVVPDAYIPIAVGQTVRVVGYRVELGGGTANIQLRVNGDAIGPVISASTTEIEGSLNHTLSDGDEIDFTAASVSSATDLSIAVILQHEL